MTEALPSLDVARKLHIIGIGGSGMSAIATILRGLGHTVSGSDLAASPITDRLQLDGVRFTAGHDASNLGDVDAVVISSAIREENPEVIAAHTKGIPVIRRAAALAALMGQRRGIAVAGTHGKTTTSAMLATILDVCGVKPTFVIGGEVPNLGGGARLGDGEWFVVEADESDGTFVELPAEVVVVTNIEPDHLEHYGSFEALIDAFDSFVAAGKRRVLCADDPRAAELMDRYEAISYGRGEHAAVRMTELQSERFVSRFRVTHAGESAEATLSVPGVHNALNATGAIATAIAIGVPLAEAAGALGQFHGVGRRFQLRGERNGVTFVDDYAHLPGEVRAALATARAGAWGRVVCVFQPHRFSRTQTLAPQFAGAFDGADLLVITDIYTATEPPRPGITGKLVVDAVLDAHPAMPVAYMPRRSDAVSYLRDRLKPGDVCLTLGAGDLTLFPDEMMAALS